MTPVAQKSSAEHEAYSFGTTVAELIAECAALLGGNSDARADGREILAAVLDVNRSWPTTHGGETVSEPVRREVLRAVSIRAKGAPLQYAVGKAAFRHLSLFVDRSVLIPRPETEILVDLVLKRVSGGWVADVGTGSGAIGLALATEGSYDRVIATDISPDALAVARRNATALARQIGGAFELRLGNLLEPLAGESLEAVVSNPPYIADDEMDSLPASVREWEPECALRSGSGGLAATIELIRGAPDVLAPGGLLALEADTRRAGRTSDILKADNRYDGIEVVSDLTGRPRFVLARRR